jgi:hypothetical protein
MTILIIGIGGSIPIIGGIVAGIIAFVMVLAG